MRGDSLVDVILLRGMNAHQGFEGDDGPLRVVDEVAIDFWVRASSATRPSRRATC